MANAAPKRERRGWRAIVARFREVGAGLAHAHTSSVVHRDFKPENVLVSSDGARTLVGDFGLAERADAEAGGGGTPKYMAPEQRESRARVTPAVDQYAFCLALSEALASARPPRSIRRALARGLSHRPEDRYPSINALLDALAFDPLRLAAIAAVALVLGAALIGAILQMVMMVDYLGRVRR